LILDEQQLRERFESGESVVRALRALADDVGATPITDYTWDVAGERGRVRQLRRATPVGLVGLTEEAAVNGGAWSLRVQVVSWKATADIAIVWHETPADGYWEMHLGDGHPQRIKDGNVASALEFVAAALAAVATP
jgi:hypothetical protein